MPAVSAVRYAAITVSTTIRAGKGSCHTFHADQGLVRGAPRSVREAPRSVLRVTSAGLPPFFMYRASRPAGEKSGALRCGLYGVWSAVSPLSGLRIRTE